ncbi:extracellular solute-binding protein [Arthrobacter sp. 24S4-2]|uniref:extracellular solute-binding protein n=1 Tax=Arthrobacter sp. 24S4-2 TaxID=2575374 RepID=UPI0020C7E27C|nr:extracellular solute-binding protein [Arthrobacter sp. 24S4-2]
MGLGRQAQDDPEADRRVRGQAPNVKIEGEYGDWSGYWDKLATQVASQKAPDIIQMDLQYLGEYSKRGALLDLKDVDLSKFDKARPTQAKTPDGQFAVTAG